MPKINFKITASNPSVIVDLYQLPSNTIVQTQTLLDTPSNPDIYFTGFTVSSPSENQTAQYKVKATDSLGTIAESNTITITGLTVTRNIGIYDLNVQENNYIATISGTTGTTFVIKAQETVDGGVNGIKLWFEGQSIPSTFGTTNQLSQPYRLTNPTVKLYSNYSFSASPYSSSTIKYTINSASGNTEVPPFTPTILSLFVDDIVPASTPIYTNTVTTVDQIYQLYSLSQSVGSIVVSGCNPTATYTATNTTGGTSHIGVVTTGSTSTATISGLTEGGLWVVKMNGVIIGIPTGYAFYQSPIQIPITQVTNNAISHENANLTGNTAFQQRTHSRFPITISYKLGLSSTSSSAPTDRLGFSDTVISTTQLPQPPHYSPNFAIGSVAGESALPYFVLSYYSVTIYDVTMQITDSVIVSYPHPS